MSSEEKGFTLLEALIVIVLFAIMSRAALLGFPELRRSFNRNAARQQLEMDLQRARAEALANGSRTVLNVNSGGKDYSVGLDEFPYSTAGTADQQLFATTLPGDVLLSTGATVIFNSSGYVVDTNGDISDTTLSLYDQDGIILNGKLYAIGSIEY